MPTIGHFIDLFEAFSRRDWNEIENVANHVVEYERNKKHYSAANKLREAIEITSENQSGASRLIESKVIPTAPPIDLIKKVDLENIVTPIMGSYLSDEIDSFVKEWEMSDKLIENGIHPRNTLLFHGVPGCGKTLLAKHVAKRLDIEIYTVQFDSLISSYLGETGTNIKKLFDFLENNRCILFIDEIDAIAKLRDDKSEIGELKRVVITLLQKIDSINNRSILIAATNHAHILDPALWRRFEIVWEIKPPGKEERVRFFDSISKEFSILNKELLRSIPIITEGLSGADIERIINDAKRKTLLELNTEYEEAFLIGILAYFKRIGIKEEELKKDPRVLETLRCLRGSFNKKYSYNDLEALSGIPHSTIHHKISRVQ